MQIIQFFLAISLMVIVHEFGHYITARMFGVRVEKFYLFFNPFFTLFKYKSKSLILNMVLAGFHLVDM